MKRAARSLLTIEGALVAQYFNPVNLLHQKVCAGTPYRADVQAGLVASCLSISRDLGVP